MCKCKFDSKKCNSNQVWNNKKCWCKCKITSPAICSCEVDKYLGSIIDDLVITCDEIIDTAKIYYDTLH